MKIRDKPIIKKIFLILLFNLLIITSFLPYKNTLKNKESEPSQDTLYIITKLNPNTNLNQVNIPFLHIDGNWTITNSTYNWMTGKGTKEDPFLIQNIIINGSNKMSCILINNSHNIYFTIKNCIFHNSGENSDDAGIYIENSDSGTLINNNCSYNQNGILLRNSSNIIVYKSILHNNSINGLFLYGSYNNTISENVVYNNSIYAASLEQTNYTEIKLNNFKESRNGLRIKNSYNNTITENIFEQNSEIGLIIEDQSCNNSLYKNYFINNSLHAMDNGIINKWNSSIIGNYWDNYTDPNIGGIDANEDGLGEIPYLIGGTVTSKDHKPIFGYPFHDGNQIYINGTAIYGNNSWIWISTRAYCSGLGTKVEPYRIKNIIIDNPNNKTGILIENSDTFFIIEECKITGTENTAIVLNNTINGIIANNNCSFNSETGIYLYNCENNSLENNQIMFNNITGIFLYNSIYITIKANFLTNNTEFGIFGFNSDNTTIVRNQIKNHKIIGVVLDKNSSWNLLYNNTFINNKIQAMDNGTHNQWYIFSLGNYWSDYGSSDINDDGIGDSPYYILGTANSIDNYPIWDDGRTRIRQEAGTAEEKEKTAASFLIKFLKNNLIQITISIIVIESIFASVIVFNKLITKKKEVKERELF